MLSKKMLKIYFTYICCLLGLSSFDHLFAGDCNKSEAECRKEDEELQNALSTVTGLGIAAGAGTSTGFYWSTVHDKNDKTAEYIEKNNKLIRTHLSIGHGKTLDDMTKIFEVPKSKEDAAIEKMQMHRVELIHSIERDSPKVAAQKINSLIR